MRYVSFRRASGIASFGRLEGDEIVDLGSPQGGSLKQALADGIDPRSESQVLPLADVTLLPVIPDPAKIFCIGLNYASHIAEMGNSRQAYPTVFTRAGRTPWLRTARRWRSPRPRSASTTKANSR